NLTVQFYSNAALLQSSIISMGDIYRYDFRNVTNIYNDSSDFNNGYYYVNQRIMQCPYADSVTRIEITPEWSY
ncbi:MAG TPA: hypothetical protein VLU95_08520, partial [Candidatus Acidoferrum sp.]|nr:hypothetical protein [Candidatus Acidoferrum sp.]